MDAPASASYGRGVSTPSDPNQPQQPPWPSTGDQPVYPSPPYGYQQQPPYGYQQQPPYGYQQYGGYPEPPAGPPRRPATLIIAGVIWLLLGALALLVGIVYLLADRIPEFDRVYADYPSVTPELVQGVGLVATVVGLALVAFGIPVFGGALWARIMTAVIGGLAGLIGILTVVVPLLAFTAIVLQFLPASNAYAKAKRA